MYAHVRDPTSIYRKRVGLTAGGMDTRKQCIQDFFFNNLVSVVLRLLVFPEESILHVPCVALEQESYRIYYNLLTQTKTTMKLKER